jgi:phospholipid/cholesterol/gamma-HCH transport system substrate-binding protein
MTRAKPAITLSVFLVVSLVASWLVFNTLRRDVPGPTFDYSATFTDVSGLKTGDDVRIAGVRVGRVDSIELEGTQARVGFRVERDQRLYTDTTATVTYQNIIGQRYIGLASGNDPKHTLMPDEGHIPVEHTRPSFDISALLNGFEPLFALLSPEQVDNLTSGIVESLQGKSGSVLTLLTQTSALAQTLAGPDAVLGELISNLDAVTAVLAKQNSNLQTLISQTSDVMATLGARRDELVKSAASIEHAVTRLAQIVASVYPELDQFITREPGFLGHLTGEGRDRFSMFAANLILVWKGLARASQSGAYADGYICDVNSTVFAFLSRVIPAVVKLASPGNIVQHSPICSK